MEIAVSITGPELSGTKTLEAHAYGRVSRALEGFPGAADRATVTVRDRGGHVYQCRIQLWVDEEVIMVVQVESADPVKGLDRAIDRLRGNLARTRRYVPEIGGRSAMTSFAALRPESEGPRP